LTTFTANAQGNVTIDVRIPANAEADQHHIILKGTAPGGAVRELATPVTVVGRSTLQRTGIAYLRPLVGIALMLIGVARLMMFAARRREPSAR
jgi:uncharacterized membrane protein